jgi:hypothetical protein
MQPPAAFTSVKRAPYSVMAAAQGCPASHSPSIGGDRRVCFPTSRLAQAVVSKGFRQSGDPHSTVTDFARFRGWSTSVPLMTAT